MSGRRLDRRQLLRGAGLVAAATPLAGCDVFDGFLQRGTSVRDFLAEANELTYRMQRLLVGADRLAREYDESDIRQGQKPNGSTNPGGAEYRRLRDASFAPYRLEVSGLVERRLSLGLDALRGMPPRTQITRHDCVEGWSTIAKWTGVQLSRVLDQAGVKPNARYVVFRCFDTLGQAPYYESVDLLDARHPQTILAYGLNDRPLPVENGAPLRVRIERQLGYKMAKYISGIEVVESFAEIGRGKGGYWEDRGYDWYAGI